MEAYHIHSRTSNENNNDISFKVSDLRNKYLFVLNNFIKNVDAIIKTQGRTSSMQQIRKKLSTLWLILNKPDLSSFTNQGIGMEILDSIEHQIQSWIRFWPAGHEESPNPDTYHETLHMFELLNLSTAAKDLE